METFSVGNMRLKHNIGFEIMRENNELFSFSLFFSTPLSTIFLLYRGGKFHWWRKPEYLEKTTDLPLVNDKCCIEYTSPERQANSQR
jgi:hypothetical protein